MENQKNEQVIMIPAKEYRKLCRKIERLKIKLKDEKECSAKRFNWWNEEENRADELAAKLAEAQEVIAGYKEMGLEKLGLKDGDSDAE
jgi:hypothetical protein